MKNNFPAGISIRPVSESILRDYEIGSGLLLMQHPVIDVCQLVLMESKNFLVTQ